MNDARNFYLYIHIVFLLNFRRYTSFYLAWFFPSVSKVLPFIMTAALSPLAGIFIIIIGLLFIFLFISWCCKMCSQSKEAIVPLFLPNDPLYNRRFMTAVDVQTGLPVIIETVSRGSRNLVRVTSAPNDGRHSINSSDYRTTYGAIVHNAPSQSDIISRTPPPPYSTVCVQPPVWYDIKVLIVNKIISHWGHHNLLYMQITVYDLKRLSFWDGISRWGRAMYHIMNTHWMNEWTLWILIFN